MKNNATHEVLLLTGTGFASRQYSEREIIDKVKRPVGNEKLKDACWNGLLKEMLPEIFMFNEADIKLYLWQVREANQFLALEMSEYPGKIDKKFSIDPYRFMDVKQYN